MKKKERLFEIMGKINPDFKPKLNESTSDEVLRIYQRTVYDYTAIKNNIRYDFSWINYIFNFKRIGEVGEYKEHSGVLIPIPDALMRVTVENLIRKAEAENNNNNNI